MPNQELGVNVVGSIYFASLTLNAIKLWNHTLGSHWYGQQI
jgi:hypothetical protein